MRRVDHEVMPSNSRCYWKKLSRVLLAATICASGSIQAKAEDADRMNVIDFLLDWKHYTNKRVTVTDCALMMLANSLVYCYAKGKLMTAFAMLGDSLPRDDRKILLSGCNIFPTPNCLADVTGTVADMFPGVPGGNQPTLKDPKHTLDQ
jgi:hypothetical protein